jgi:hypothetical protein
MDKLTASLLGAIAGLATIPAAQAASSPAPSAPNTLQASSYADLLEPVQNAVELLKQDDARAQQPAADASGDVLPVYYGYYGGGYYPPRYHHHHHHHHHHSYYGEYRRPHHHHHHHHHNQAFIGVPGIGGIVVNRR